MEKRILTILSIIAIVALTYIIGYCINQPLRFIDVVLLMYIVDIKANQNKL